MFGSAARGEDDENSDIDFLVELEEGRSLLDLGGLLAHPSQRHCLSEHPRPDPLLQPAHRHHVHRMTERSLSST